MKGFKKFVIFPILCVVGISVYIYLNSQVEYVATDANIDFIREHMNSAGTIIDYYNEICVKNVEDIKAFIKDDKVTIEFGKISLTWELKDFVTTEVQERLKSIGITVFKDSVNKDMIRIFWNGEEVTRWAS